MRVKFWGTRGSVPVSDSRKAVYGGNTTCVQLMSECLPPGCDLIIDGGSGFVPYDEQVFIRNAAAAQLNGEGRVEQVVMLFTHYHHDHGQGLPLGEYLSYNEGIVKTCYGPVELGVGPKEMLEHHFQRPFHPVDFGEQSHHWRCKPMKNPSGLALISHPEGGVHLKALHELNDARQRDGHQMTLGGCKYPLNECLIVRMLFSEHPERTISYRFDERRAGRSFVLLTDHECQAATPMALRRHLCGANLLVMDSQYTQLKYDTVTAGFGHGTAPYCVRVANEVGAEQLGLTHHGPRSTDQQVEEIEAEGHAAAVTVGYGGEVFALRDYQELEV